MSNLVTASKQSGEMDFSKMLFSFFKRKQAQVQTIPTKSIIIYNGGRHGLPLKKNRGVGELQQL